MPDTTSNTFETFRELVLEREELQTELREFIDKETFIERVIELGSRNGYDFSRDDVEGALRIARREWIERAI